MSQSITQQEPNTYKAILHPYMLVLGLSVIEWSTIRVLSPVLEEKKPTNLIWSPEHKTKRMDKKKTRCRRRHTLTVWTPNAWPQEW